MNFGDVLKKIFVDDFFTVISVSEIIINLLLTTFIGIFIYVVYRLKNKTNIYLKEFNVVLICLPIITSAIVLCMKANLALSFGMLGALSIVRFRNAIKSSMDLLFLFWSISVGIICGGGLYSLAVTLSIILAFVLTVFDLIPLKNGNLLLVINLNNIQNESKVIALLKKYKINFKYKSKSIHNNEADLIMEIHGKQIDEFIHECAKLRCIININLVSHDGEMRI